VVTAIAREKEIKKWRREKKDAVVVSVNPEWKDLSEEGNDFSLLLEMTTLNGLLYWASLLPWANYSSVAR
jgi:hypothetical protein